MTNEKNTVFDPRVYLFLMFGCIGSGFLIYHEVTLFFMFVLAAIWLIIALRGEKLFSYIMGYAVVWGLTRICVFFVSVDLANSLTIFFSSLGSITSLGRKAFPAMIFAFIVMKQPTGSLLASFYAMKIPKAVGIGLATMLRFPATFSEEYRYIRNAEKFRGIGVGFWHTLAHLPSVLSNVFIPLVIRITRISEELAASVTVRGVRFHNEVVSFNKVKFTKRDAFALLVSFITIISIFAADKFMMEVI